MVLTEFSCTHKKNNTAVCLKTEAIVDGVVKMQNYRFNYNYSNHSDQTALILLMTKCRDLIEDKTPLRATISFDDYNRPSKLDLYKVGDDVHPIFTIIGDWEL